MLLDVTPPTLGMVYVLGELNFEDERDYNFTANLVSLLGSSRRRGGLILECFDIPL